ncbi:glutathionylspermidine synthase family protein [Bacillus taeanensis]|uniref:Glutathionylspermidine synthase family protein n=1 Tax=Bacillus taeanensis TaxID=273032 RepID=A0A366XRS1_9BACI|nr:glutathionylspermidine synthase family protein [Bacillus taeanensis]RBW67825.1 glutathionylspermidine synthase family protein [Bacillus taeanensis]
MDGNEISLHNEKRRKLYEKIANFWFDLDGEPYALYDLHYFTEKEVKDIHLATKRAGTVYFKTAQLLREVDDETLLQLGIPKEALFFVREKTMRIESVISRLDFVKTEDGLKVLEANTDTPTFIMECNRVNSAAAAHFHAINPNEGMEERLGRAVRNVVFEAYHRLEKKEFPSIVFTAHRTHTEDWHTITYLQEISGLPAKCLGLDQLRIVSGDGLYDEEGNRIDVLYRQTYPIEYLIYDRDEATGEQVGLELMKLVSERKLGIVNPPSAFLLQTKAVQAVIWGLYEERHPFFTEEEHHWIETYFLPTYLEEDVFLENKQPYVKKPCFGREGGSITLYNEEGKFLEKNQPTLYDEFLAVYQQCVELPKKIVSMPTGEKEVHLLIGSFLINGEPGAIGVRAGNKITGNESCFLPIGLKKDYERER